MIKSKLPFIIAAVAIAAVAAMYMLGIIGGHGKAETASKKYVVPPVSLAEPFTVNTNDSSGSSYLQVGIALQLEPMEKVKWDNYSGANAGEHGATGAMPGADKVANYPKFRNAVIEAASGFSASELRTAKGKEEFKAQLLESFHKISEVDEAAYKAAPEDTANEGIDPPYHVMQIEFTQFAVQEG